MTHPDLIRPSALRPDEPEPAETPCAEPECPHGAVGTVECQSDPDSLCVEHLEAHVRGCPLCEAFSPSWL